AARDGERPGTTGALYNLAARRLRGYTLLRITSASSTPQFLIQGLSFHQLVAPYSVEELGEGGVGAMLCAPPYSLSGLDQVAACILFFISGYDTIGGVLVSEIDIAEVRAWAREGGAVARRYFNRGTGRQKADRSWITEADVEIERFLSERIAAHYPEYGIMG